MPFYSCLVFRDGYSVFDTCGNTFHAEYAIFHLHGNCFESLWIFCDFLEFENCYWTNFYTSAFAAASIPINNNLWHKLPPFLGLIAFLRALRRECLFYSPLNNLCIALSQTQNIIKVKIPKLAPAKIEISSVNMTFTLSLFINLIYN